ASQGHIMISRRQGHKGPVDDALQLVGLERNAVTYVDGISTALALVKGSDLVATVPERHTQNLRSGMFSFPLPITSPVIMISMLWHPRMEADPAHRWLRQCVLDVCGDDHQGGITLPP
ncbi:LysR substrate-binding domain-containing protein, partial [Escherichia coli]